MYATLINDLGSASLIGFEVELLTPVPRRTYRKHHFLEWGGVTRETLRQLKIAQRCPLTTLQIASAIDAEQGSNLTRVQSPPAQGLNSYVSAVRPYLKLFYAFSQESIWHRLSLSDLLRQGHLFAGSLTGARVQMDRGARRHEWRAN